MQYDLLDAPVPGEMGENTVLDTSVHPPIVHRLEFVLDIVPEDPIFTTFPAYIVTGQAKADILKAGLSGVEFGDVEMSTSDQYSGRYRPKPNDYAWIKVPGRAYHDDFGLVKKYPCLVVSQRALDVLEKIGLAWASFELSEEA